MVGRPDCQLCKKIKRAVGKEPDCIACTGTLMPENELIFLIFWRVKNQVIMTQTVPLDMRLDIVRSEVARYLHDTDSQDYCLDLITHGFNRYLQTIRDKQE